MMNLWVLTVYDYGDCTIHAVFDDEHKSEAEWISDLIGGTLFQVPFNHFVHDEPPPGMEFFRLAMRKDGRIQSDLESGRPDAEVERNNLLDPGGKRWRCQYEHTSLAHWTLRVSTYAKDKNHAVQIANDIRMKILSGELPGDHVGPIP